MSALMLRRNASIRQAHKIFAEWALDAPAVWVVLKGAPL
jgi:hypothetical protein